MQNHFFSVLTWIVFLFIISIFVSTQGLNAGQSRSSIKKIKSSKQNSQRTSIDHEKKANIMVTNLAGDDQESSTDSITKIAAKCTVKGQCVKLIQHKIFDLWNYRRSHPKFKTVLVLELSRDGYITAIRLKQSSGRRAFDDSVLKAVRRAAPFTEITYLSAADIEEFSSIELVFKR
ncbi:MAG: TonB family protein [Thiohalomonadales bacterium]